MPGVSLQLNTDQTFELMLGEEFKYAQEMKKYHPKSADILDPMVIPVIDWETEPNEELPHGALKIAWYTVEKIKFAKKTRQAVIEMILGDDDYRFKQVDPDFRRTPGQPYAGMQTSYIDLRFGEPRFVEEIIYGEEEEEYLREIGDSVTHGWMLRRWIRLEIPLWGRYRYWYETEKHGSLLKAPIPQIPFQDKPHPKVMDFLRYCMDTITPEWREDSVIKWRAIRHLLNWICWSLGSSCVTEFPADEFDGRVHDRLYQVFNPIYLLAHPHDHLGAFLDELSDEINPVPKQISMEASIRIADELFFGGKQQLAKVKVRGFGQNVDHRQEVLIDVETGSGRIAMAASNYCNKIVGVTTHPLLAQVAIINRFLFDPAGVFPYTHQEYSIQDEILKRNFRSRAFAIAKRRGLDIEEFFAQTRRSIRWEQYRPIQLRSKKVPGATLNQGKPAQVKLKQPTAPAVQPSLQVPAAKPQLNLQSTPAAPALEGAAKPTVKLNEPQQPETRSQQPLGLPAAPEDS